ncbi:MAG: MBL fold metallo-hydrolase [Planctomycetota bacterium]
MIKLRFCGGARTVTGSMHLIKTNGSRILIDCGLFQGRRRDFYDINNYFVFPPNEINALILSHAHIDHSGNIPNLVKHGMRAAIHATSATVDLCNLMLPDSGHIQEEDIRFVNKINLRKGLPPVKPLYTKEDAYKSLEYFRGVYYEEPVKIAPEVNCTFYESGHVLGSAIPVVQMNGIRLAYAVDLGRKNLPLLKNPVVPKDIDYLIIESTYGNRLHDPIETAKNKLAEVINKTIKRGGRVIIPSFAFERTQEVVYFINELVTKAVIPMIPIYVDSPLATDITFAFQQNIRYLDEKTQDLMRRQKDPFGFSRIKYIRSTDESRMLNADKQPMVIISASGMCEAGRILHHLKNNIENPNNTVLVIGYMAENTLGKKIVERQPTVKIFGEEYRLRAEVVKLNSFSAHADKDELLEFIRQCAPKKRIFIVHGDLDQAEPFLAELKQLGLPAYLPSKNEEVTLE